MKIIAFAGSNSSFSINKKLVQFVSSLLHNHTVEIIDLNSYTMPIYGIDYEIENGIPDAAFAFANKIDSADLLLISLAEHNGAYTTAFKNIFDWMSRIPNRKTFGDKNIFLMATSPGARGGQGVLELAKNSFPHYGGNIIESFSLPSFNTNFDDDAGITNLKILNTLKDKLNLFF